ncbi:protein phosphatase 2C domain-containing protein [Streptomyces cyaneofuscatus]|uniref:protein phosphatase 2C domain-containing protein n=1 Tax=Streptomyces cyaneofuscatus TaxID=66883 RepID=UPI00379852C4|nr:protein phosphatase 2C domain-containing protein [Streptomyces cyaneofuscatus]
MSQQGEKPAAHEDDWWRKLYDETAPDTGPSSAPDSLDDRFDSVSDTVSRGVGHQREAGPETAGDAYAWPDPDPDADPGPDPDAGLRPVPEPQAEERLRDEPEPVPEPEERQAAERPAEQRRPEPTPDPRTAWEPQPERTPYEDPQQERAPYEDPQREQAPYEERELTPYEASRPERVPAPAPAPAAVPGPRNTVFPAPWEAPAGPPGPRTFAVPKPPEPEPPPATVPDPVALHELPPDWAASDAPADGGGGARPLVDHLGDRPPTYEAEPAALPAATSENLDALVPDTVLDGARYGTYTLRAASVRGDSARFRGEPRRDALLTARFGAAESALVLVAVAGGVRGGEGAHLAAADACRWIGGAVARSHARLSEDIRAGRRADLKSGLHRLTDRTYGKLRARAAELGLEPGEYTTSLRCLLLSADPDCRTRVFFGVGSGGLFRLRDGLWQDLEPVMPEEAASGVNEEGPDGDRLTMDLQITTPPSPYSDGPAPPPAELFRFRASVARPNDTLLLCSNGFAEPMRGEPELPDELAERWGPPGPPGLPAFLADTQLRIKGYADDRTCAAVWEA